MPEVLHVIASIDRGGAENHLFTLTTGQAKRGWKVTVAYLKGNGYWRRELERHGIDVVPLEWRSYADFAVIGRLRRLIESRRPDCLHAHLPAAEVLTRLAWRRAAVRPRFIISKHSDDPLSTPMFWLGGFWAERAAAEVLAISGAVARYLRNQHRLAADRIRTIHYGLDPAPYDLVAPAQVEALRREWKIAPDELLIGTVARIAPQKRIDLLIEALASLRNEGLPARLVVVGAGPDEAKLRELARARGVESAVVWAGKREDITVVMRALDVFALCSDYEGFGLVLLESMAASRPIVATRVSAIPEIVVDGSTGYLCPPGDAGAIAQALRNLVDAGRRRQLGEAGRARLEREFTVDKMVEATLALYAPGAKS